MGSSKLGEDVGAVVGSIVGEDALDMDATGGKWANARSTKPTVVTLLSSGNASAWM